MPPLRRMMLCAPRPSASQSVILRKGGIAEGRDGFRFRHDEFLLFPTLFHEQVAKLKLPPATPLPALRADGQHEILYRVRVEWTADVTDWEKVRALAPFHLWEESEIEKQELIVLKAKARAPFGDAAFAQDDALRAVAERVTDESPFFEAEHG